MSQAHLNHEEDKLTMTSLRPIKAGEEILNYYGPLPNCDLLRRYGYTSPKHRRYDVVELPWELVKSAIDAHVGKTTTSALEEDEIEESFVLERESGDPDETGVNSSPAEFVGLPEELEDQVYQFVAPALNINGKVDKTQKRKLKSVFAEVVAKAIEARMAQYATSVEEDQELLRKEETNGRSRMAVEVRLGEKRLLMEAKAFVQEMLEKYGEVEVSGREPQAKKQRR